MATPETSLPKRKPSEKPAVFLNLPYDRRFERLFLAYIAGISAFGMLPHATLELPNSQRRLDLILQLIAECEYSVHDLSRVQLDRRRALVTPRFNMPFELGLAVAHHKIRGAHTWYVFEEMDQRVAKSLSDLGGTDVYIHGGTLNGLFSQLLDAFVRGGRQPTVPQMWAIYRVLRASVPDILHKTGARTVFKARPFYELSILASGQADKLLVAQPAHASSSTRRGSSGS